MNQKTHMTKQMLKKRGWTETLISRFLSYPDEEEPNPVRKGGAPMQLYLKSRIREIESSEAFEKAIKAVEKRRRRNSKK